MNSTKNFTYFTYFMDSLSIPKWELKLRKPFQVICGLPKYLSSVPKLQKSFQVICIFSKYSLSTPKLRKVKPKK